MKKLLIFLLVIMPFVLSHAQIAPPPTIQGDTEGIGFRVTPNSINKRVDIELTMYYRSWFYPTYNQLQHHYAGILSFYPGQAKQVLYDFGEMFASWGEYAYFECIDDYRDEIIVIDCFEDKDLYLFPRRDGSTLIIKKTYEDFGTCLGAIMFEITHIGGQ